MQSETATPVRIHALLRREGHEVNHKRAYRLYRAANLAVKRRKKRKGVMVPREPLALMGSSGMMSAAFHARV